MTDYVNRFLKAGGQVTQLPPGNSLRENDGMTPQQIDKQKWAVRVGKSNKNNYAAEIGKQANT